MTVNELLKNIFDEVTELQTRLEEGENFIDPSLLASLYFYKKQSEEKQKTIDQLKKFIDHSCRKSHLVAKDWNCPGAWDESRCGCDAIEHNKKIDLILTVDNFGGHK